VAVFGGQEELVNSCSDNLSAFDNVRSNMATWPSFMARYQNPGPEEQLPEPKCMAQLD
jgi:hypothetical protein